MNKIDDFRKEYRWLSNFEDSVVIFDGLKYPTVEHAYQAAKSFDIEEREQIRNAKYSKIAKQLGQKVTIRKDWDKIKIDVMENLLIQKFNKGSELARKLLNTKEAELIEGNTWGDIFWGVCNGIGQNNLGKLLMKVRDNLKDDSLLSL